MTPPAPKTASFTASQIAAALGCSRQAVQRLLAGVEPDGQTVAVNGPVLAAWAFPTLPARLKDQLEKEARRQGFRDAMTMLSRPSQPWEPARPLAEVSQDALDRAIKRQRALAPRLLRKDEAGLSQAHFKESGVAEYRRAFGYALSTRHWESLWKRTLKRDAGAENWSRLDLYLDEKPARKTKSQPALSCSEARDFQPLCEVIATFRNPAAPSDEEKACLWARVFEFYEAGLAAGKAAKKFKRALLRAVFKIAPFLPAGANALRVSFNRKCAAWLQNHRSVAALSDQRKTKSGNWRAPELKKEDRDQIIAHAVLNCGGRVSQAWRELVEGDPGYVGRDEMKEVFERVQKLKLEVERRKINPAGRFYSAEQWFARLDELCARYNAAPQEGKMTLGLSPQDAFEQYQNPSDPPIKLDARCRHLLSHHKRPVKVTSNGITLRFGKQAFTYRNEITGQRIGQTVLAWFNPETPDILAVTDMNRENPVCLPLSHDVPAMDAPPEILARESSLIEAHQSYAKVRYSDLKQRFATSFRRNLVDAPTAELGQAIERDQDLLRAEQKEEKSRIAAGQKLCRALNMPTPFHAPQRPETLPALARLKELMETEEPAQ
jgi:hypothetical protein